MFGKGENLVATDYQMVRHPDIHQAQCLYQTFGDKPVCLTFRKHVPLKRQMP
ncbi:hypothetical protein SE18019_18430 [Escherichia coli O157:H7]|nr:hypothetical protein SE18019_18430 [Escherichia coli O157:H7]